LISNSLEGVYWINKYLDLKSCVKIEYIFIQKNTEVFYFNFIQIRNFNGPSRVVVTLVTDEDIPRPHAHKLVGKNCSEGTCIVELKTGNNTAT